MIARYFAYLIFSFSLVFPCSPSMAEEHPGIPWTSFSDEVFLRAAAEHKLVLLDVEAVWCHWCHVMEKETYSDPGIQRIIQKNFIPVRVDQDARPDISTRYQDYGWPATIVLSSDGTDLVKRSGFMPKNEMKEMLEDVIAHPTPHEDQKEPPLSIALSPQEGSLSPDIRKQLIQNHEYFFDEKEGGLDFSQKFFNSDSIEFLLTETHRGNERYQKFVRTTLTSGLKLIDPVWGGAYQYSTDRDWDHPHFEKIVPTQALNIRAYSYGYAQFQDPAYLSAAQRIYSYLNTFLRSPEGAFYTSQDADIIRGTHSSDYFALNDTKRRKQGIPAIDTHQYSYENGLLISALSNLYAITGDQTLLANLRQTAQWIIDHRSLPNGGFRHDEKDSSGPYLRDSLAMGQGFLSLYAVTGDRSFLNRSLGTADFITANFAKEGTPGFVSYSLQTAGVLKPSRLQEENISAARYLNLLRHYSGNEKYAHQALIASKWLTHPQIALQSKIDPGILLVDAEISSSPIHITIVGHKDDSKALSLFQAALKYPSTYKRTEWWDKKEGAMPNPDVTYPEFDKAAAFVCTQRTCSLPIFAPEGIERVLSIQNKK